MDWAVIISTLVGPILAVQAQKLVEHLRERRNARRRIFKTLMATRGNPLSSEHVQSLNLIDLEFSENPWYDFTGKKECKGVLEAWRELHHHLFNAPDPRDIAASQGWRTRIKELRIDLLYCMSRTLGYPFDKTQIRESWYAPMAHDRWQDQQQLIQDATADILVGRRWLMVKMVPENTSMASNEARPVDGSIPQQPS